MEGTKRNGVDINLGLRMRTIEADDPIQANCSLQELCKGLRSLGHFAEYLRRLRGKHGNNNISEDFQPALPFLRTNRLSG